MREFRIRDRTITDDGPPFVLCDLSHNHLGDYSLACEMIRVAAHCGADGVKLQKRGPSVYDGLRAVGELEYAQFRQAREFGPWDYERLVECAHGHKLDFLATAFDIDSAEMLASVGVDGLKLASGDVTNLPLLEYAAKTGLPIILSTGGSDLTDVRLAHRTLTAAGARFALLHCTSAYPCDPLYANLRVLETYRREFPGIVVGWSSHVDRQWGADLEVAAFALGARIFEKHFTLTPGIGTGEHAFALGVVGLTELVSKLRTVECALGDGVKRVLPGEEQGILRLGKHLVWAHDREQGYEVRPTDFAVLGGGRGLRPDHLPSLVGATLRRRVRVGEAVEESDLARSPVHA